ncbi:Uma2 family endonuclease [Hippea alviniae]|uniref:Uma2 family endonuclease n=1 Tax=Hippea alviniae TaxID=1279027 RepID=UPI0003B377F2|nr:Uma2 family endonuclease [Hippea alviniae]
MLATKRVDKKYTYSDYKNWPDDERWEIINGVAYNMSPAPKIKHQVISRNITGEIYKQKDKLNGCVFFEAPTDVVFDEYNVVQPDILIVCDKNKITEDNIQGAPDLIIEILSKSTEIKDRREKLKLYEMFKVKEYIIINPDAEYVERYLLKDEKYTAPEIFNWDEEFKFKTFDIEFKLWEIFEKEKKEDNTDKKQPPSEP